MRLINTWFAAAVLLVLQTNPATAVSTYSAIAVAGVSVSTDSAGGLSDLGYVGSTVAYSASAQASFDEGVLVSLDDETVFRAVSPIPLGGGADLGDLLFKPVSGIAEFGSVMAVTDEAEAFASGAADGAPGVFNLTADVDGKAFDTGDPAFANSKVRWNIEIFFQNLSDMPINATWTINHVLGAEAMADPRGTAYAEGRFEIRGAEDVVNAAGDPPPNDKVEPSPPSLSGTTRVHFALAPQQIKSLNFALEANGNATIVPLPASGALFLAGIAMLTAFARRGDPAPAVRGGQRDAAIS